MSVKIFYIIILIVLLINMIWIVCLTIINKRLDEELHQARMEAINEINKLRKTRKKD